MTQIRIDTEHAAEVGRRLISAGGRLDEIGRELQHAIGALDTWAWDGASRARAEPLLSRVRPGSQQLGQELDALGRRLVRVAAAFEQEDDTAARNMEGMPWVDFIPGAGGAGKGAGEEAGFLDRISGLTSAYGDFEDYRGILASLVVTGGLVSGSTYAGQVIFYGSRKLKDWAGLSPYLTHIKNVNIPSHMAAKAFDKGLSRGSFLLEGFKEIGENWKEYEGDIPKVAIGVAVDTLIGVGISAVFSAGGTAAGAALGGALLGPVGAVVGGKIGGVLGKRLGDWVAEEVEDIKIGDRELDQTVVEAVDHALDPFVDSVARLF